MDVQTTYKASQPFYDWDVMGYGTCTDHDVFFFCVPKTGRLILQLNCTHHGAHEILRYLILNQTRSLQHPSQHQVEGLMDWRSFQSLVQDSDKATCKM